MKCEETREILNLFIDDGTHPKAEEALDHTQNCRDCQTWYAETLDMVSAFESAFDDECVPDIATAVMSCLPERHPASVERTPLLKRLFFAVALSWVAGAVVVAAMAVPALHWLSMLHRGNLWTSAKAFTVHTFSISHLVSAFVAFTEKTAHFLQILSAVGSYFGPQIIVFLVVDSLLLLAVAAMWRRRSHFASAAHSSMIAI